jgi:1-acyl-sn-glycerol-3-phosphate acyltransferase
MESIEKTLKAGINILIFPEGTRSNNGSLNRFKMGAFKIAKKYNAPIEMLMLTNTQVTLSKLNDIQHPALKYHNSKDNKTYSTDKCSLYERKTTNKFFISQ